MQDLAEVGSVTVRSTPADLGVLERKERRPSCFTESTKPFPKPSKNVLSRMRVVWWVVSESFWTCTANVVEVSISGFGSKGSRSSTFLFS